HVIDHAIKTYERRTDDFSHQALPLAYTRARPTRGRTLRFEVRKYRRSDRNRLERKRRLRVASRSRDPRWCLAQVSLERPREMRLIRVPGLARNVERRHAPAQHLDGPFGPPDLAN